MLCHRCGMRFEDSLSHTWENACPRCGCLAWLHRGMTVSAQVESLKPYAGPVWKFSARVTLGDNINGIAGLQREVVTGNQVRLQVDQVDHRWKLVMLIQTSWPIAAQRRSCS